MYNKNDGEQHNSSEGGNFANLETDSSGDYTVDLEKFTASPTTNDEVYVSVYVASSRKKGMTRKKITAGSANTGVDIVVERLEPHQAMVWFLRSRIKDPQTGRGNTIKMIKTNEPRGQAKLTKTSFPRVSVRHDDEEGERAGSTATEMLLTITLKIGVHIWVKEGNTQSLSMSDDVSREGQEMRDYLLRDIANTLKNRFFVGDPANRDPMIQDMVAYTKVGTETPDDEVDEERGTMKKYLMIQFKHIGG